MHFACRTFISITETRVSRAGQIEVGHYVYVEVYASESEYTPLSSLESLGDDMYSPPQRSPQVRLSSQAGLSPRARFHSHTLPHRVGNAWDIKMSPTRTIPKPICYDNAPIATPQYRIVQNQSPKFDYNKQGAGPKIRQYEDDVEEIDYKQGTIYTCVPKTRYDDHEIGLSHKLIERDESLNNFTNKIEIEQ